MIIGICYNVATERTNGSLLSRGEAKHMKNIAIVFNSEKKRAKDELAKMESWLKEKGCGVFVLPSTSEDVPAVDFAVTLGGDGTMLSASRLFAPAGIPILGVNLGSLGFLAETNPVEVYGFLDKIIAEGYQIEERMMLNVTIESADKKITRTALNDCIIRSTDSGRVIRINVEADGEFVADYVGDGLIVSTPTGSTAYSLAASGPIVHPSISVFVLTPICPHTLAQRPMIISAKNILSMKFTSSSSRHKSMLSLDGQTNFSISASDKVVVSAGEKPLKLITNPERKYYGILREKLKWGERG